MSHTCYHPAFEQADIRYALGVDGGGTGTRVRVWTSAGALVGHGEAGPSALSQGVDQAWQHIEQAIGYIDRALQQQSAPAERALLRRKRASLAAQLSK